ncbi:MAG: TIGR03960 family B12-binding radical SAM protein [Treponema sp.]|nr:TIGR03960 family B12-binding radical SAM protein [Treponema sp.]
MRYVDPVNDLGDKLLKVEKPGRYTGGEFGLLANREKPFQTLIAFPDLYEIGMGNQALRIIYNRLNEMEDVSCDRAFAPAPDFEKLLRANQLPLYGLETGLALSSFDMLMFTLGYELGLNGILLMLDLSNMPLFCKDRTDKHPIVIAGGPAVSNPLPYSPFIDAFWIGEAEAGFFDLAGELARLKFELLKLKGQSRAALLEKLSSCENVWVSGKTKAKRAIYSGFSYDKAPAAVFPIPSMKIIHNHGNVEIMRGCPNGCRFCHAGFWYRPMRQKSMQEINAQTQDMAVKGGWQQISLSSLSSGDYCGVDKLVDYLNGKYAKYHISFQMPSLKVSGFSLELLEKISETRKSGLTFAVETPKSSLCDNQKAINKEVTKEDIIEILNEAKKRGWKSAKFYFMIGLPLPEMENTFDEEEIVNFVADIGRRAKMRFKINIGIFIPKPHTPYQWAAQIDSGTAVKKMDFIREKLKPLGHKVSVSDPLIAKIEGLLSRGDERAGLIAMKAYLAGSRLDPWNEYINKEAWQELLDENRKLAQNFLSGALSSENQNTPWDIIDSCVKFEYLKNELDKSKQAQRTAPCGATMKKNCSLCGVCAEEIKITANDYLFTLDGGKNNDNTEHSDSMVNHYMKTVNVIKSKNICDPGICRIVFSFSKKQSAVFHGHLSLVDIFSMAFRRAGISALYTKGFNPLAKMEFASPLSTGISACNEIAAVDFEGEVSVDEFKRRLNKSLPHDIHIQDAQIFPIPEGVKKRSLASLLWGFAYKGICGNTDYVNAQNEKAYRQTRLENDCGSLLDLRRLDVLARNIIDDSQGWKTYFDVYEYLYGIK